MQFAAVAYSLDCRICLLMCIEISETLVCTVERNLLSIEELLAL